MNEPHLGLEFQNRLRKLALSDEAFRQDDSNRRTALALHEAIQSRYHQLEKERKMAAEAARLKRLEEVAQVETQLWDDVFTLIGEKKVKSYDQAIDILKELRALAKHKGHEPAFDQRIESIKTGYSNLSALQRKLRQANF